MQEFLRIFLVSCLPHKRIFVAYGDAARKHCKDAKAPEFISKPSCLCFFAPLG